MGAPAKRFVLERECKKLNLTVVQFAKKIGMRTRVLEVHYKSSRNFSDFFYSKVKEYRLDPNFSYEHWFVLKDECDKLNITIEYFSKCLGEPVENLDSWCSEKPVLMKYIFDNFTAAETVNKMKVLLDNPSVQDSNKE